MNPPMLTGYRVLDFSQFVAGPTCSRILAELGAEVIKVELAPEGDRTRSKGLRAVGPGHRKVSSSSYFFQHNHSKKSLAVDLKNPKARELLRKLAAKCDIVIENFAPGVMARAGLAYEDIKKINPKIVMCSISFAGQTGPLAAQPGYDYIAAAYSGITSVIGDPNGSPAQVPVAIGDVSTGVTAAMAVGFALLHRERTGQGQYIETTLLDTYFHMHESNVPRASLKGSNFVPKRAGAHHPDGGPTGIFRCRGDEFIVLTVLPHQWEQLVKAMNMPELLTDPRFTTAKGRRDNNDDLVPIIESWLAGFPTRAEALAALEKERVPCAPVLTLNEAIAHPHLRARGTVRTVKDPRIGEFDIPGLPARFSEWNPASGLHADLLGEHNEDILKNLLGLSPDEIGKLYAEKILVCDPALLDKPPLSSAKSA